ncbi:MAG: response regulator [Thermodesulfobacteriota bacterium]
MHKKTDILIVDDRPENLLALENLLEEPGLNIVKAGSGNEALSLTFDYDFALVLLDVQMPVMDGFETAELLRSRQKTRHIPIIFVTAISKEERHVFRGYETGAVDYLFKPIDPQVLTSKVRIFVELHERKMAMDRTARRLEETVDRLRESEESLRRSEEKYRLLVENANDAVVILQDDRLRFHNRKAEDITGYTGDELARKPFFDLVHSDDREMVRENHRQTMIGETTASTYAFRILDRKGNIIWGEVNAVPIRWEKRPAVLCFVRDISQQRKLEAHLQQAQKMEAIGTLAGGIAHDFNNILGVIIGYSEMAVQDIEDTELVAHNLDQVLKASHRAKELVQQILTFSHKNDLEHKPVIINPIVKESLKMLRASLPKTIEIRERIPSEMLILMSNPTQIHQILMNLCTNAAHAMDDIGGIMEVTLQPWELGVNEEAPDHDLPPGAYLKLTVRDTGHGMAPEVIQKIFDPYFTTKPVGKGTGMGLAVVHGIVQSHQGSISVSSSPAEGTLFEIVFPRLLTRRVRDEGSPELPAPLADKRILLVDDERLLADLGKQMLERLGYVVDARTDSVQALEDFRGNAGEYDLVITDMTMPGMTGDVLSREVIRIRSDIPIILCTGYNERINPERAKQIGIKALLMKPLAVNQLARAIHEVLTGSPN